MSNLEDSIVLITSASDKKANVIGTGFAFYREQNYTYLLTCAHVVNDVGGNENVLVNNISAEVLATGNITGFDLAVLRVENLNHIPPLQLISLSQAENRKFRIAGHYLYGEEKKIILETVDGTLGKKRFARQNDRRVTAWNLSINEGDRLRKGYSGGPVVDQKTGRVLGIATNMEKDGAEGLAISVEALKKIWSDIPSAFSYFYLEKFDGRLHGQDLYLQPSGLGYHHGDQIAPPGGSGRQRGNETDSHRSEQLDPYGHAPQHRHLLLCAVTQKDPSSLY